MGNDSSTSSQGPGISNHPNVSTCPRGETFALPRESDYAAEWQRLEALVREERGRGREIVVVVGVGFVGAVMAGVVADSVDPKTGAPGKFVIGMQRPSPRSFWKIGYINRGVAPVEAEDPEVALMIHRCVQEKKTLIATYTYDVLRLADVVIVDVQCDYHKESFGDVRHGHADIKALEECLKIIGEKIDPNCLVLIETTVPPGTTEYVAYPIVKREFERRGLTGREPLLSHSFERVMPGRNYVASVRDFWRVCSGINAEARQRVVKFLSEVLNVAKFPLTVLDRPIESETCKIVENSYRAAILAFMHEWGVFAERNGVDLVKVLQAIKVRPTHSNIMFPGPGIGGYCLPKDGGLGFWSYHTLLGFTDDIFKITPAGHRHQRHPLAARGAAGARRAAQHGQDRGGMQNRAARSILPRGCGRHPVQRLRGHGAEIDRDGGRDGRARPLPEALVGVREAARVPGARALAGAVFPQPGATARTEHAAQPRCGLEGYRRRGVRSQT